MHSNTFALAALDSSTNTGIAVVLLLLVALLLWLKRRREPGRGHYVAMALTGALLVFGSWSWVAALQAELTLDTRELKLDIPFYTLSLPRDEILSTGVRRLDFALEPEFKPQYRRNGMELPGLHLGWFTLQDGRKALMMTGSVEPVLIPTRAGYVVIVSVADADRLMGLL